MTLPERVPPLSGWGLRVFLAVWGILLSACLVLLALSAPEALVIDPPKGPPLAGLVVDFEQPDRIRFAFGPEATRAGIKPGDRILAVDGAPVAELPADRARQFARPTGGVISLAMQSVDGSTRTIRLTLDPAYSLESYRATGLSRPVHTGLLRFFDLLQNLVLIGCALLLARRLSDPLAPWASLGFLLMALGQGFLGGQLYRTGTVGASAWLIANNGFEIVLLTVVALFPDGLFVPRWRWAVIATIWIATLASIPADSIVQNAIFAALMVFAAASILQRYRTLPAGQGRQQIRWAMFGFGASAILIALIAATQWVQGTATDFTSYVSAILLGSFLSALVISVLAASVTVPLLRYRLYDADTAISRSVAYGALTIGFLGVFAASEKLVEVLGEEYFGERLGALAGGIGAGVAAVLLVPLHHRLNHWADHRFRKQLINLRDHLPALVGDLREVAGLDRVAASIADGIVDGVRANRVAVLVGNRFAALRGIGPGQVETWRADWTPASGEGLEYTKADPLLPIRIPLSAEGHGRVGWLLLGPRPDGSLYGRDERAVLSAITDPLARAIEIVQRREQREADQQGMHDALARDVATLKTIVANLLDTRAARAIPLV